MGGVKYEGRVCVWGGGSHSQYNNQKHHNKKNKESGVLMKSISSINKTTKNRVKIKCNNNNIPNNNNTIRLVTLKSPLSYPAARHEQHRDYNDSSLSSSMTTMTNSIW